MVINTMQLMNGTDAWLCANPEVQLALFAVVY